MSDYKKTICFDFDGVCATYDGWRGIDVFGDAIPETANLVKELKAKGFRCVLWTTRKLTPELFEWLGKHGFDFDSINSCDHNPPDTSIKPIAELYVDDRAYRFVQSNPSHCASQIKKILGVN